MIDYNERFDFTAVTIDRKSLLSMDFSEVVEAITMLDKRKDYGYKKLLLSFKGYTDHFGVAIRSSEVKDYMKALMEIFPHLFFYLNLNGEESELLAACFGDKMQLQLAVINHLEDKEIHLNEIKDLLWLYR